MSDMARPGGLDKEQEERAEVWREGVTMALYISLSLLAVMAALPADEAMQNDKLALVVALTSVGLVLAHQVAFRMSSRLVTPGSVIQQLASRLLRAQLLGGAAVTVLAVVPILLFGPDAYRWSMALLALFVLAVGYLAARSAPHSPGRSLIYVLVVAVLMMGVLAVKSLVGH
jgi:peptidoglycan/LPS O-acetylase OafA/YrhL